MANSSDRIKKDTKPKVEPKRKANVMKLVIGAVASVVLLFTLLISFNLYKASQTKKADSTGYMADKSKPAEVVENQKPNATGTEIVPDANNPTLDPNNPVVDPNKTTVEPVVNVSYTTAEIVKGIGKDKILTKSVFVNYVKRMSKPSENMYVPFLDITYLGNKTSTSISYEVFMSIRDAGILIMTCQYYLDAKGKEVYLYMQVRDDYGTVLQNGE